MKLKFFNVLQQFKKQIVDGACEQKEPEKFLTSEYIANSFWEFVRNANVAEDEAYYLEWYEEEHGKNAELDKTDFIFSMVLGVQERMDIAEEYLNLCNKEKEYIPCGLLRCIRRQIRSGRQQMRHWNFMRLSQEGKILTDLYGLQLPTSLFAPDLMRRIRMLS